jgi:hypothetical protein
MVDGRQEWSRRMGTGKLVCSPRAVDKDQTDMTA